MNRDAQNLRTRFKNRLEKTGLIKPNQSILIAVSGGMDSMCLWYLLRSIQSKLNLKLAVGHVNHGLRPNALRDQEFVRKNCRRFGNSFYLRKLNPGTRKSGESLEAWARQLRYQELEALRLEAQADVIATAHHANDQIETILLRLSTGSGIKGLQAINARRDSIVRPLLSFSKQEIVACVNTERIRYCEDESNDDVSIPRNYLRKNVITPWEEFDPNLSQAFRQVSEYATEFYAVLEYFIDRTATKLVRDSKGRITVNISTLGKIPLLARALVIQRIIDGSGHWRRHILTGLKSFLEKSTVGQVLALPNEWKLLRDREDWILVQEIQIPEKPITIRTGDTTDCGDFLFSWNWRTKAPEFGDNPWREVINGQAVEDKKLILRPWTNGDDFIPLGIKGKKKISDFLTDLKVDRFSKKQQLVLTADDEIIWVCGKRISDPVKITPGTRKFAELTIIPKVG